MNARIKLLRLTLASSVGSLLWAGCAQPRYSALTIDPRAVAAAPLDQTRRAADTHPELRSGLWQMRTGDRLANSPQVIETSVVSLQYPGVNTVDSTHTLPYRQEVINVALAAEPAPAVVVENAPGAVVTEAAGAEPGTVIIEETRPLTFRQNWRTRLMEKKQRLDEATMPEIQ
jgi:hypothetical protein